MAVLPNRYIIIQHIGAITSYEMMSVSIGRTPIRIHIEFCVHATALPNGAKMPHPMPAKRHFVTLLCAATLTGFGATGASGQMSDATVYEYVIKPQEEKRAAEIAEIMARPSNWGPGEIRSNGNYGGIAWYSKGGGDYGYIVARGYISPGSAAVQMEMECDERKVSCEGIRPLSNQWLVIGRHPNKIRFVTASAETRAEAEALVLEQCKKEGATCVIQDAFNIMPHKRGMSFLRPKVEQR